jgi:hypothetical protein
MAAHQTGQLYDRREDCVTLDEVVKVVKMDIGVGLKCLQKLAGLAAPHSIANRGLQVMISQSVVREQANVG